MADDDPPSSKSGGCGIVFCFVAIGFLTLLILVLTWLKNNTWLVGGGLLVPLQVLWVIGALVIIHWLWQRNSN